MLKISKDTPQLRNEFRAKRDNRLAATDSYMLPDRNVSEDDMAALIIYRQTLRDAPNEQVKATEWTMPLAPLFIRFTMPFVLDVQ